ncbi:glycoside hydrolase family 3 C-terminal domain-containing protein [Actinoalloteichus caeruleus]|uniref:Exo-1,4-beta-glucosidase n=1 Tax=Actinoalloteichus caeruleus DSM 43889 TaxID=1120930 RepID=A0ABT1JD41_ACTCY|nr:glycoside hydrolase family 3 C-terminal domain-containing protein [Actinoalloteichus caeruleus]MCP2330348.1 exo-1,4-beta-glucosidase (EC 3.2.1.74) [Actinoalloteichus caeruleus DSM 43889]
MAANERRDPEPVGGESRAYLDPELPIPVRVDDLLGRLDLRTRIALLHQVQPAVPELGMAEFRTGGEVLHGLAWLGPATVFPQAVGLGATWNPELVERIGSAVGDEVRGFHHDNPDRGGGLNVWAPVVNPLRDPRWGRNEEGYAEDPLLTGTLATAYAAGLRGHHPRYWRTAPTLKHFLGYNNETDRDTTSSDLRPRVLHEYELPAFEIPLRAGAAVAVMPSYNLVNGRPAHLSPLINDTLREWAGPGLAVFSDAYAPSNIAGSQGYLPDHPAGFAAALRAGVDSFTEHDRDSDHTIQQLSTALDRGLITEDDVDTAVRRLLAVRFRLGEFDPPEHNPYAGLTSEVINRPSHRDLAAEAARQALVLLRNEDETLPLDRDRIRRLAVIGWHADTLFEDWYSGTLPYRITPSAGIEAAFDGEVTTVEAVDRVALRAADGREVRADPTGTSPLRLAVATETARSDEALFDLFDWGNEAVTLRAVANARYVAAHPDGHLLNDRVTPGEWVVRETFELRAGPGGTRRLRNRALDRWVRCDPDGVLTADGEDEQEATAFLVDVVDSGARRAEGAAAASDVAIVVLGNDPHINGRETEDRLDIELPPVQEDLLRRVVGANPRTVLVVVSGYPMAIPWADERVPAILWTAHGGQEQGTALGEVLFGDHSPGGRLPQTWYRSTRDLPDPFDYDIISAASTYLYHRGEPLYPFGHGLSYTRFDYGPLRADTSTLAPDAVVTLSVEVTNSGDRDGDEVVQLYSRHLTSCWRQPRRRLRGFRRLRLRAGERRTVEFVVAAQELATWNTASDRWTVEHAEHEFSVGASSADQRATTSLLVLGERVPPRVLHGRWTAADSFDDQGGVHLVPDTPLSGTAVAGRDGAWLAFHRVSFPAGRHRITVRASTPETGGRPGAAGARIEFRPGVGGAPAVPLTVPPGSRDAVLDAEVETDAGVAELRIVFTDGDAVVHALLLELRPPEEDEAA